MIYSEKSPNKSRNPTLGRLLSSLFCGFWGWIFFRANPGLSLMIQICKVALINVKVFVPEGRLPPTSRTAQVCPRGLVKSDF